MSEYIAKCETFVGVCGATMLFPEYIDTNQEIVRCRDCEHYYEADNYHPWGNHISRCCKYFDSYNDEVDPDGFCAWASRKEVDNAK